MGVSCQASINNRLFIYALMFLPFQIYVTLSSLPPSCRTLKCCWLLPLMHARGQHQLLLLLQAFPRPIPKLVRIRSVRGVALVVLLHRRNCNARYLRI